MINKKKLCAFLKPGRLEAGCDEAGRGCLAGPVFAAAVILPSGFSNEDLDDSKKLSEKQRIKLRLIIEKEALAYAIGIVDHLEIDRINIQNASFLAMHRAIEKLQLKPEHLLIDGNRFKAFEGIPHTCIVKGDGKYLAIAAASILAKTYRDDFMNDLHLLHPQYQWIKNKGYPTSYHRETISKIGICTFHRKSFANLGDQLKLDL